MTPRSRPPSANVWTIVVRHRDDALCLPAPPCIMFGPGVRANSWDAPER